MSKQAEPNTNAILKLASGINANAYYGSQCLEKFYRQYPSGRKADPMIRLGWAKEMILKDINALRQKWAKEWFYFGNNPRDWNYDALITAMESEMWALWLLNEQLKVKSDPPGPQGVRVFRVESATFGKDGIPALVLRRLADFDVVYARNELQVQEQSRRIVERRNQALDDPDHPPAKEDFPLHNVGELVDTQKEIEALESWAKKHRPRLNSTELIGTPRTLKSLEAEYEAE